MWIRSLLDLVENFVGGILGLVGDLLEFLGISVDFDDDEDVFDND